MTLRATVDGYQDGSVGTALSQSVTGLTAGAKYYYRLRARERDGGEHEFGDAIGLDAAGGAGGASGERRGDEPVYAPIGVRR